MLRLLTDSNGRQEGRNAIESNSDLLVTDTQNPKFGSDPITSATVRNENSDRIKQLEIFLLGF